MTEFTVAAVGGGEPVLQAGPVHHGQAARAVTRGQQLPRCPALMADPAERLVTANTATHTPVMREAVVCPDSSTSF